MAYQSFLYMLFIYSVRAFKIFFITILVCAPVLSSSAVDRDFQVSGTLVSYATQKQWKNLLLFWCVHQCSVHQRLTEIFKFQEPWSVMQHRNSGRILPYIFDIWNTYCLEEADRKRKPNIEVFHYDYDEYINCI